MAVARRVVTWCVLVGLLLNAGCSAARRLSLTSSPHDAYASMLRGAGLDKTTLGTQWTTASESALRGAVTVVSPFSEAGYFAADRPTAIAYRLQLERGRRLVIDVSFTTSEPGQLFVDLFRSESNGELRRVTSLDEGALQMDHLVEDSGTYVIRLQPELLRSGRFTVAESTRATIRTFPVSGLTARAIQSGFGAQRDSGARSHEGVDVFAPRGTPVLAVTNGIADAGTNALGGNVVWLRGARADGIRYYYAHLDRWSIEGTVQVREGDVLGYVGNSGNARTTAPHLHFGVYDDGPLDPAPFLASDEIAPRTVVEPALLGTLVRTRGARTPLLVGPRTDSDERARLGSSSIAHRLGVSGSWHRLQLPDGTVGYVRDNAIVAAGVPLRRRSLTEPVAVRERPASAATAMATLEKGTLVEVLGHFREFELVRTGDGVTGWTEARR